MPYSDKQWLMVAREHDADASAGRGALALFANIRKAMSCAPR